MTSAKVVTETEATNKPVDKSETFTPVTACRVLCE